MPHNVFTVQEN